VKARSIFREELASGDDLILIAIDAFHDHRSSVQFVTNPNGLMVDTLQAGETAQSRNPDRDTVWLARGSRDTQGWAAEVVIPFKSLRFEIPASSDEVVFGIGFKRNIARKNEEPTWPFVSKDSSWYRPAELGHLRGLRNIRPGRSLEIRPCLLAGASRDFVLRTPMEGRRDVGVDVKWGVTPNLTADFSLNTDFAQEEADLQQVNLTRFSLFFPEKRQFFLEGRRMFQLGVAREADLVFTRRMGLSEAGEVIPLRAGARLSGRHGRLSMGLMNLQSEASDSAPAENFTVLAPPARSLQALDGGSALHKSRGRWAVQPCFREPMSTCYSVNTGRSRGGSLVCRTRRRREAPTLYSLASPTRPIVWASPIACWISTRPFFPESASSVGPGHAKAPGRFATAF
jgi:hypothetical protein